MRLSFESVDFEWSKLPPIMWMGLIQSVEALIEKDWLPWKKREFCQQMAFGLKLQLSSGSPACQLPCRFWICQPPWLHEPNSLNSLSLSLYKFIHTHPISSVSLENLTNTSYKVTFSFQELGPGYLWGHCSVYHKCHQFFSSAYGIFIKIDHMLNHKISLSTFQSYIVCSLLTTGINEKSIII